jgi:L-rhamnose isomerase
MSKTFVFPPISIHSMPALTATCCPVMESAWIPDQLIEAATKIEGLTGVEVVGMWHVNDGNVEKIRRQIGEAGLEVTCVTPDIWASSKWGWGSITSRDPVIRREAVQEVKRSMEWAKQLNCEVVDLWFGQDGYDYPSRAISQAPGTCSTKARWTPNTVHDE